jgi:hypothetical protein
MPIALSLGLIVKIVVGAIISALGIGVITSIGKATYNIATGADTMSNMVVMMTQVMMAVMPFMFMKTMMDMMMMLPNMMMDMVKALKMPTPKREKPKGEEYPENHWGE